MTATIGIDGSSGRSAVKAQRSTIGDRALSVAAAKIWNTLLADVTLHPHCRHSNVD